MKYVSAILFASFLSGCATAYHPVGFSVGYSETQLGENIFHVSFRGNGHTSEDRAEDFSLLRAAELTINNGYRYFGIVDSEKSSKVSAYTTPTTSNTTASATSYGNHAYGSAQTITSGGQTYFVSKPRASNTIVCFKEKPESSGLIFDAMFVMKSIKQKYGIGE